VAFGAVFPQILGFAIHFFLRGSLSSNIAPRDMRRASQSRHST
jgi:hypothetical protein